MKRIMSIMLLAVVLLTCTAYAAEPPAVAPGDDTAEITVTEVTPGIAAAIPENLPTSVESRAEGGVELLVKTYETPRDADPAALVEEKPERGGVNRSCLPSPTARKPIKRSLSARHPTRQRTSSRC